MSAHTASPTSLEPILVFGQSLPRATAGHMAGQTITDREGYFFISAGQLRSASAM